MWRKEPFLPGILAEKPTWQGLQCIKHQLEEQFSNEINESMLRHDETPPTIGVQRLIKHWWYAKTARVRSVWKPHHIYKTDTNRTTTNQVLGVHHAPYMSQARDETLLFTVHQINIVPQTTKHWENMQKTNWNHPWGKNTTMLPSRTRRSHSHNSSLTSHCSCHTTLTVHATPPSLLMQCKPHHPCYAIEIIIVNDHAIPYYYFSCHVNHTCSRYTNPTDHDMPLSILMLCPCHRSCHTLLTRPATSVQWLVPCHCQHFSRATVPHNTAHQYSCSHHTRWAYLANQVTPRPWFMPNGCSCHAVANLVHALCGWMRLIIRHLGFECLMMCI